jgi:glycosyltransferase involved in cell wall biosynthesis
MKIFFWQNCVSQHQSALLKALSKNHEVTLIVQETIPNWRKNMGWKLPELGDVKLIVAPSNREIIEIVNKESENVTHIFSSIRSYPLVRKAFKLCYKTSGKIGILSEAYDIRGYKGLIRLLFGITESILYSRRINFILAIGHIGVEYYTKKCYFPKEKVYPFGYFVEDIMNGKKDELQENSEFKITFIGQCIYRKGVDILLKALAPLKGLNWSLDIIGDGRDRRNFEYLTNSLGLSSKVNFRGVKKHDEIIKFLKTSDLLVLPSRFDGWGAVINEALTCGVPVVASDNCGAATLIQNQEIGDVFPSESVNKLREVLFNRISNGKLKCSKRERIREWSKNISGEVAAQYLVDIIKSTDDEKIQPIPPWFQ